MTTAQTVMPKIMSGALSHACSWLRTMAASLLLLVAAACGSAPPPPSLPPPILGERPSEAPSRGPTAAPTIDRGLGGIGGSSGGGLIGGGSASGSAPGVALPSRYEIVSHVLAPTESYLPGRNGMPTGVVLLDASQRAKNESLCKALLGAHTATVRTEAEARRANPSGDFLVTNWPVKARVQDETSCSQLLAGYDFERAARIKGAYGLNSRGPMFLALDPTGEIVFLDLRDASPDAVFKATSEWMQLALTAPETGPASRPPPAGLVAGTSRLFAQIASGFSSLVGGAPELVRFNDPIRGTARQFNIYKAGAYQIGATFTL